MNQTIKQLAVPFMSHPMISRFASLPSFPSLRVEWLRSMISEQIGNMEKSNIYALVASLLQLGLDTHDEVPASNNTPDLPAFRGLQLKVLAGDYFSSRYYQILSQIGDIKMVNQLAEAVCVVNQRKIKLYHSMERLALRSDDYLQQLIQIKTPIFLCFRQMFPQSWGHAWDDLLAALTRCELLWTELQTIDRPQRFFYWYLMEVGTSEEKAILRSRTYDSTWYERMITKYNPIKVLLHKLEQQIQVIEQLIRGCNYHSFLIEWQSFIESWRKLYTTSNVMS